MYAYTIIRQVILRSFRKLLNRNVHFYLIAWPKKGPRESIFSLRLVILIAFKAAGTVEMGFLQGFPFEAIEAMAKREKGYEREGLPRGLYFLQHDTVE